MKVLLVGNYAMDGQESMLRFASMMEQGLRGTGHQVRIYSPPVFAGKLSKPDRKASKWLGYLDKMVAFRALLSVASRHADVVHICDHSNAFYVGQVKHRPHVVTCHDLIAVRSALSETPLNRPRWSGRQLQRLILKGLTRAQHVACVSEATRSHLLRPARLAESRVSRVYNGLNYPYSPMPENDAVSRIHALGLDASKPFILHVGGNTWYKNRLGVLRVFAALRERKAESCPRLVMVGKAWTTEMKSLAAEAGLGESALEVRDADSEDLRALYSMARMMLFPSLEEGFGWPIIEAQACGCVVVTSNRSPMDEVGGSAAVYVDPEDVPGAAGIVANLLDREERRREQSISNANRFTTAGMIRGYVDLYQRVINEHS